MRRCHVAPLTRAWACASRYVSRPHVCVLQCYSARVCVLERTTGTVIPAANSPPVADRLPSTFLYRCVPLQGGRVYDSKYNSILPPTACGC